MDAVQTNPSTDAKPARELAGMQITVAGAGNGGCAAAADLALGGAEVTLFELPRFARALEPVRERGGIRLINSMIDGSGRAGEARVAHVTSDAREATTGATVIVVATQSLGHEAVVAAVAPFLQSGQTILFLTGYGSSIAARRILAEQGVGSEILVGETVTLPYASRLRGPAEVELMGKSYRALLTAAMPADLTPALLEAVRPLYPELVPATNVLETALLNSNVTRHTIGTLLNLGWIESPRLEFAIYRDGFSPAVWRVHDALDAEKMALMRVLGLRPRTFAEYRKEIIDLALDEQAATYPSGPSSADTRYLHEDVPMGLVFFASLGETLHVPTPTAKALIHIASVVSGRDYAATGRTVESLGLGGLDAASVVRRVESGA